MTSGLAPPWRLRIATRYTVTMVVQPIVAASGIAPGCCSNDFGPERLHSTLGGTDTTMNTTICNSLILGLLTVIGCASHQPHIVGRWQVSGTDNVVTLSNDHSAQLISGRKTINGNWRTVAPDILILTVSGGVAPSAERSIVYKVPLNGHEGRSFKIFSDTESKMPSIANDRPAA